MKCLIIGFKSPETRTVSESPALFKAEDDTMHWKQQSLAGKSHDGILTPWAPWLR